MILIVDDSSLTLQLLRAILESSGARVECAMTGDEARCRLATLVPDLIMLDVILPDIDGYVLCRQIKAAPRLQHIPVLFLSVIDEAAKKALAFSAGGADYVTKPFQVVEVLARVDHQVQLSRLRREVEREKELLTQANQELLHAQKQSDAVFGILTKHLLSTLIDGKYRLLEKIGSGGFGVVYRAEHVGLQRQVAVKIFRPLDCAQIKDGLRRFRQEAVVAARVSHPNAVQILDSGMCSDGMAYLVMELLSGCTLRRLMSLGRPLPLPLCLRVAVPVCEVLDEAQRVGLVHRDIKPDNIFLHETPDGVVVKVLDFGLAKQLGQGEAERGLDQTRQGDMIGTPAYISPERLKGQPYDVRSDIYSLGVMLFQMLCGRPPFYADPLEPMMIIYKNLHEDPPRLREFNPEVPGAIEEVVMTALAKHPAQRPDASGLRDALLDAAGDMLDEGALYGWRLTVPSDPHIQEESASYEIELLPTLSESCAAVLD